MSQNSSESTKFVFVKSSGVIQYGGQEGKLHAKLLWPSFFEWDASNYEELFFKTADRFMAWVNEHGLDYLEITQQNDYTLKDMIAMALYLCPSEWRKAAREDENSLGAIQVEAMVLVTIAAFLWDDSIDTACPPGTQSHYELKQAVASTLEKIMNQDFKDLEEIYQHLRSIDSILLDPKYKTAITAQQKVSEYLRDKHGINAKNYPYMAIEYRMLYDYLTIYSGNGLELIDNSQRQEYHRCYTVGSFIWPEMYYTLSKLNLHPKIREDKYFKRLRYLAAKITYCVNDILSFEREVQTSNSDNGIKHFIDGGLDIDSAIDRVIADYNSLVLEICELKEYLESGKHSSPTDMDPCKAAQLDREYKEAIKLSYVLAVTNFQAQIVCSRYKQSWYFD